MKKLFTLLLVIAASIGTMQASDTQIDGIWYDFDTTTRKATVTYRGANYSDYSNEYSDSVVIPASVTYSGQTYSVIGIGEYAFLGCTSLISVTIPNSVTSIGRAAFYKCSNLTTIIIPSSVTIIEDYAFRDCSSLTSITIPSSVTSVGDGVFRDCNSLISVVIPNGVTSIGNSTFYGCTNLISVAIPNGVTSIGNSSFYGCTNLISVVIPNSVASIGSSAFQGCSSLPSVTIPNSVTNVANYTFRDCSSLTSITIPSSVTVIGDYAFRDCSSLTSITIPSSVTSVGDGAFSSCSGLKEIHYNGTIVEWCTKVWEPNKISSNYSLYTYNEKVTELIIPNSITNIGSYTFAGCTSMVSVTIPNSIISIEKRAFYGCIGLSSVTISNGVTSIVDGAFRGCSGLLSITIPNSVNSIGNYAFCECPSLTSILVESGNSKYDSRDNCNAIIETSSNTLIVGCKNTVIPNSVTSIGSQAFYGCSDLISITIPSNVTSIGSTAFSGCTGLTNIYATCGDIDRVKQLLNNDSRVKYMRLPYTISIVAQNNGNVSTNINEVTICDEPLLTCTATANSGYHFTQWSDGNTENPRTIILTQDTTFTAEFAVNRNGKCGDDLALTWNYDETNKALTISGEGALNSNYTFGLEAPTSAERLIIADGVTSIGNSAFADYSTLKHLSVAASVKTVREQAFYNCTGLQEIYSYRATPPTAYSNTFDGIEKFECVLHVISASVDMYKAATGWRDFYYVKTIDAEEVTVPLTKVEIEPHDNNVIVTWPTSDEATSYTLEITKDGVVFCTLIFNANGQLQGIAFAPGKNGTRQAPTAVMTSNGGLRFTVTGLDSGTNYHLTLDAKNELDEVVVSYDVDFETTGQTDIPTGMEETDTNVFPCKILRNGQVYIQRGDKTYTLQGVEVK